jgi:hypothetical protein
MQEMKQTQSVILRCLVPGLWILLLIGCQSKDPFGYVQVSGRVTYEDGSPIPLDGMLITFYPQGGSIDAKTHPRPGTAGADKNGEFKAATSHKPNDGLVCGRHKVTLLSGIGQRLPTSVVPAEYADPAKTPLEVDTANLPFVLKVRKPK